MFGKKSKGTKQKQSSNKDFDMEIDIAPINDEHTDIEESKGSKLLRRLVFGVVIVIVILGIIGTVMVLQSTGDDDTEDDLSGADEIVEEPEAPINEPEFVEEPEVLTPQILSGVLEAVRIGIGEVLPTIDGFVTHRNGYVNLEVSYPETWFLIEKAQEGFDVLSLSEQVGLFNLEQEALASPIPFAELVVSREFATSITLDLYGKEDSTLTDEYLLSEYIVDVETEVRPTSLEVSSAGITLNGYTFEEYDQVSTVFIERRDIGNNMVVAVYYDTEHPETESHAEIFTRLLNSIKTY